MKWKWVKIMDMSNPTRLNDVFPEWVSGGGIFSALQSYPVPWRNENINGALDMVYHGDVSGGKIISPLVESIKAGDTLTNAEKAVLAGAVLAVCGVNWGKQWDTLSLVYNPIENYSMTEIMTNDETVTEYGKISTRTDNLTHTKTGTETDTPDITDLRTDNLSHGKTGTETLATDETATRTDNLSHTKTGTETIDTDETDTRTDNLTETTTPNLTTNTANTVHGFNSTVGVPTGEQVGTETGTNTVLKTGTQATVKGGTNETTFNTTEHETGTQTTVTDGEKATTFNTSETDTGTQTTRRTGSDEREYNTVDTNTGTQGTVDSGSDTHTRNYELTRAGNIGVTTSQQMIESERKLWWWNFFYNVVFPDIDRVLTLQIY